ncbi:OmpA family protein [Sorangium sp. So ce1014]|uniref:OmpA family protein n=1 Tax=Sorangium sp. So ce1014 TaxID=3133326 RepID=UPI003F62AEF0
MNELFDNRSARRHPGPRSWPGAHRVSRRPTALGPRLALALLVGVSLGSAACGGITAFEGGRAFTVVGQPPPPPPPPPPEKKRVEVKEDKIVINEKILFEHNKAGIRVESHSLLNEVVDTIKKHPHIKKIAIEGHASADGEDDHNLKLSDRRSKAVMEFLVQHGIPQSMLTAKGFGETKPIADNESEEGREKNRRVEFNIVEQDTAKAAGEGQ